MKNYILFLVAILFSLASHGQCTPLPIYGAVSVKVGDTTTLINGLSGGTWSVSDSNIAIINSLSGRITGKSFGTITVTYYMPGSCRLFPSTRAFTVTPGIRVPNNVCVGGSITLFDSVATGGGWSSADTALAVVDASTGILTGISTGMVTISYTFSRFGAPCTAVKRVTITRGINGRRRLYLGDALTYSDTATGGTWRITDSSIAAVNASTGLVRARALGRTFITYTNIVGGRTCTASDTIWVGKGIAGHKKLCLADTTTFIDSVAGGTWTSSNTAVATVEATTGRVHAVSAGYTVIMYSVATMGTTFYIPDSLQVIAAPSLTHISPLVYCGNIWDSLAYGSGPVTWNSANSSIFSIERSTGVYSTWNYGATALSTMLKYTSLYCSYIFDSTSVTINPVPNPGTITGGHPSICPYSTATFTSVGASMAGTWYSLTPYFASVSTSGVVTGVPYYFGGTAWISYIVTNAYGCSDRTETYLNILARPSAGSITGLTTLNIGLIGNFRGTGSGTSESWSVSDPSIASVSSTGQLTPLAVGTLTLKHFYYNSCGSDSVSTTVSIVPPATGVVSTAFTGFVNSFCSAPEFGVSVFAHSSPYKLKTFYGEGNCDSITLAASSATSIRTYNHSYANTGSYSIKQILYNGTAPVDSVFYTYHHVTCNSISLSFFQDADHDCAYTASVDHINYSPMNVVVDSNGVAVDTLSVTGGLYYEEWGNPGDIYGFRLLSPAAAISCPSSGIVYDTLSLTSTTTKNRSIGFNCLSSAFDVRQASQAAGSTGRHHQTIDIHLGNSYCAGEDGYLYVDVDPRYGFQNADPYPVSIAGSRLRWNFSNISNISGIHPDIKIDLEVTGGTSSWIANNTPIYTSIRLVPTTGGDLDTNNNATNRVDTVKSSYDPNMMLVTPSGNILNGTTLHYTIEFENDGNDTAHNIYVMDTLPDYVNASSLQLEMATHRMNTSILHYGGHNIIKFDFPNIMLPDSSHHYHCTGSVMFNVKAKYGLANGSRLDNHAGIFFDDNPVVLTDTAHNVILIPTLTASSTCRDTICHGGSIHCSAAFTTVNTPHYQWYVNASPAGSDSTGFTSATVVAGDAVKCVMRTVMDDTIFTTSNNLHITERALPDAGVITGTSVVCPGSTVTLADTIAGGTWTMSNARATIAAGVVTGVTTGMDTAIYTVTNICYPNSARLPVWVHPLPNAGVISGFPVMCDTSAITLSDTVTGGHWYLTNAHASVSASGRVTGVSGGLDTACFHVTNMCGSDTSSFAIRIDSVVHLAVPGGPSAVCQGLAITLTGSVAGGAWTVSNSHAWVSAGGVVTGSSAGTDTIIYTIANTCGTFVNTKAVTVNPTLTPVVNVAVTPSPAICEGYNATLSTSAINGGSSPIFMWEKFGVLIGTGATLSYVPAIGDIVVCKMVSDALCRSVDTVAVSTPLSVTPSVAPSISIIASPSDTISYYGQLITFYSTTTYGGTSPAFQWYVNNAPVPGATSISYSRNVSYNDTVWCTMSSDITCVTAGSVASNTKIIYGDYLGIQSHTVTLNGLSIFPNPNKGTFTLSGKLTGTESMTYEVMEVTGKVIYKEAVYPVDGTLNEVINLGGTVASGQYFIKVVSGANVAVLKFVVE